MKWVDARYIIADDLTKLNNGDLVRCLKNVHNVILVSEENALLRRERERDRRREASARKVEAGKRKQTAKVLLARVLETILV